MKPAELTYSEAKAKINLAVRNILRENPLPFFAAEGILSDLLSEYRKEENIELTLAGERYLNELKGEEENGGKDSNVRD